MPRTKNISKKRNFDDPVNVENISYGSASQSFNVKKQTLQKQVMNFRKKYGDTRLENINKYIYHNNYDVHRIFDDSAERDLVLYIIAEMKYVCLTKQKLRVSL